MPIVDAASAGHCPQSADDRSTVAEKLAEARPVARGRLDHAAADHRSGSVELRLGRPHAEWLEQPGPQVFADREMALDFLHLCTQNVR